MIRTFFYILILLVLASCSDNNPDRQIVDLEIPHMELIVPNGYITAGKNIALQLVNENDYRGKLEVQWFSALSSYKKAFNVLDENSEMLIRGDQLKDAGLVTFHLLANGRLVDTRELLIKANDIVDPIEVFTGPNTIWINDLQPSMIVSLPKDKFNNPGREGDSIRYELSFPDGSKEAENILIKNQLAFKKLSSKSKAGKIFVGVSDKNASAKEQRVNAIELWPRSFKIEMINWTPYADKRQFCELQTSKLIDENNQQIPDGTLVKFTIESGERNSIYNAYSIDGVATVFLKNPAFQSDWKVEAFIGSKGIKSNSLMLSFDDNVKEVPINIEYKKITVGPITSYVGQYVPDGTIVYFFNGNLIQNQESENGFVEFEKPNKLKEAKIRVAGKTIVLEDE